MQITDRHFGIDSQARAFLELLATYDFTVGTGIHFNTFAFYNGRERWAGLEVYSYHNGSLFLVFGEDRNSDSFCLQMWEGKSQVNPPTLKDMPEEAYQDRRAFKPFDYSAAFDLVTGAINQFITEAAKE